MEVHNLTKKIGNKTLVSNISFTIQAGQIVGFLGENGAGKTTTIRMLVGLTTPTSGKVKIAGFDIRTQFTRAIRHVGGIIESPELYGYMTGHQNLMHYARMSGIGNRLRQHRIRDVIDLVGLKKSIHRRVKNYSLGMRQRLGLAQALLHQPSLLILDEPTNGLDPAGIREIRQHLQKLAHDMGMAVLVSSHLLAEMEAMCDRIILMKRGRLLGEQSLHEPVDTDTPVAVTFVIEPILLSKPRLRKILKQRNFETYKNRLMLTIPRREIPEINRNLVASGFFVYEVQVARKSLEERFLEANQEEKEKNHPSGENQPLSRRRR